MKAVLFIFTIGLLSSCNGLGSIDESILKGVYSQPGDEEFFGTWEIDSASYSILKRKYPTTDPKVLLVFNENHEFESLDSPDCLSDPFGDPVANRFIDAFGLWEVEEQYNRWELKMSFDEGELFEISRQTWYSLFKVDSTLCIVTWIGDPDSGERLLYNKVK